MRTRRQLDLIETDLIQSPAIFGLIRGRLLLPRGLTARFSGPELRYVFLHELAHLKRGDLFVNWLMTVLQVLHWFNPVIWFALGRMRADRELACDTLALSVTQEEDRKPYGQTIIKLLEGFARPAAVPGLVGILEDKRQMHRRIQMIAKFKRTSRQPWLAVVLVAVLGLIALTDAQTKPVSQQEEKPNVVASQNPPVSPQATGAGTTEKAPPAGESDTIVDPKTGLKFTVTKKISGENDVVVDTDRLSLSPNGKFLLWRGNVIPLDGSKAFKLEALHGAEYAAWSPEGKLIAYRWESAIWLLPVAPETGQPTGPARKLVDEQLNLSELEILWSRDSEWIIVSGYSFGYRHTIVSVQDGRPMQPPDYTRFSLRSPDQRSLAYFKPRNGVWTVPVQGGASRLVAGFDYWRAPESAIVPLWWSPDGDWLLRGSGKYAGNYDDLRFVRLADHHEVALQFPKEVGRVGLGVSPNGRKLQLYKTSYEGRDALKVAPIRGGGFAEVAFSELVSGGLSSPDGQRWFFVRSKPRIGDKPSTSAPCVAASAAADPVEMKLPEEVRRESSINWWSAGRWGVSPDGKRLFRRDEYRGARGETFYDFYVIPISLEKAQSTGPATLILKEWFDLDYIAWSPDSSRLAIYGGPKGQAGLWVVPADGNPAKQLTPSPEDADESPRWSPDGKFIAYSCFTESPGQVSLYTIPSDGGAPKRLWMWTEQAANDPRPYVWFPDGREIGLVSDGALVAVDIADGSVRPFLKLAEAGFTRLQWFQWSPDGRTLGLCGRKDSEDGKVILFRASDKKIEMLPPDPGEKSGLGWTGDSQSIFCFAWQYEKVRPAALIYEVDLEEAWTQAKNRVAGASSPASASPIAKLEAPPLVNGEFRDDFEDGDTKYWTFQDVWDDILYEHVREMQNGELVLENTRAIIGLPEWRNYVVTVKMCIKRFSPVGAPMGVRFRSGEYGEYCLSAEREKKDLWLGIRYPAANKRDRTGTLAEPPYNFVLDKWHTVQVEVKGPHIVVRVDGQPIIDLNDENCPQGAVALISGVGARAHFDDFSVRQLP